VPDCAFNHVIYVEQVQGQIVHFVLNLGFQILLYTSPLCNTRGRLVKFWKLGRLTAACPLRTSQSYQGRSNVARVIWPIIVYLLLHSPFSAVSHLFALFERISGLWSPLRLSTLGQLHAQDEHQYDLPYDPRSTKRGCVCIRDIWVCGDAACNGRARHP